MTGPVFILLRCGFAVGVCSAVLFLLRRAVAGDYPQRTFRKIVKKKKTRKRKGRVFSFCADFLLCFLTGTYLVLYDATVLGGRGRFIHLAAFICGLILARFLFLSVFFHPIERAFMLVLDCLRAAGWCLLYPFRKCFALFFGFLFRAYLIMKRKNDKIRKKRKAKREIARLLSGSETSFLPSGVTEAIFSGRE